MGGIVLIRTLKNRINHPSKNDVMGVAILAGKAGIGGAGLRQAVVAYHAMHEKYPNALENMVLQDGVDGKLLHNDLDSHPNLGHVAWIYQKESKGPRL